MIIVYCIFAVLVVAGYYYYYLKKDSIFKPKGKETTTENTENQEDENKILEPVLARIFDRTNRKMYNKMIDGLIQSKIIKEYPETGLGRQWNKDGKWVYTICREFENTYTPVEKFLVMNRLNPPTKLHGYLSQPEVAIAKDISVDKGFMEKYGHYLPYILAILFLVFLMVMQ